MYDAVMEKSGFSVWALLAGADVPYCADAVAAQTHASIINTKIFRIVPLFRRIEMPDCLENCDTILIRSLDRHKTVPAPLPIPGPASAPAIAATIFLGSGLRRR